MKMYICNKEDLKVIECVGELIDDTNVNIAKVDPASFLKLKPLERNEVEFTSYVKRSRFYQVQRGIIPPKLLRTNKR